MRSLGVTIGFLLCAAPASAERRPSLGIDGGFAIAGDLDASNDEPVTTPYLGATLAFDTPPPAYPAEPGYAWAGALVPQLSIARLDGRGAFLLSVRLEADYAQKQQGLLRVSARGSLWLAPKLGFVEDAESLAIGGDIGSSLMIFSTGWTFGYWFGVLAWNVREPDVPQPGVAARLLPGDDTPLIVSMTAGLMLSRAY
jgi:hypothetical protein